MIKRVVDWTYKAARRLVVAVVGATVLLIGVIMLVTPSPAIVVIPVGLAILSIEFTWARLWLKRLRRSISNRNSNDLAQRAEDHQRRAAK